MDALADPTAAPAIRADVAGNALELIETGEGRLRAILELIAGAQQSVKILMYMFNTDMVGERVRDALTEAARRGVAVKLLIDGFGSAAGPSFFAPLEEAGGCVCVFNPAWGRRYLLRNHQKLIVIDSRTVLIGGANIDATYLGDQGSSHWRDLWLRLDGPEAKLPSRYFDSLFQWSRQKGSKLRSLQRMAAGYSEWRGSVSEVVTHGINGFICSRWLLLRYCFSLPEICCAARPASRSWRSAIIRLPRKAWASIFRSTRR